MLLRHVPKPIFPPFFPHYWWDDEIDLDRLKERLLRPSASPFPQIKHSILIESYLVVNYFFFFNLFDLGVCWRQIREWSEIFALLSFSFSISFWVRTPTKGEGVDWTSQPFNDLIQINHVVKVRGIIEIPNFMTRPRVTTLRFSRLFETIVEESPSHPESMPPIAPSFSSASAFAFARGFPSSSRYRSWIGNSFLISINWIHLFYFI